MIRKRLLAPILCAVLFMAACAEAQNKVQIVLEKGEPQVRGLAKGDELQYFGKVNAKKYFVIYQPKSAEPYDFVVLIGPIGNLKPVKLIEADRMRDGGTTTVETAAGTFFFPSPTYDPRMPWEQDKPRPKVSPTFKGRPLYARYR